MSNHLYPELTLEFLKSRWDYDPISGLFIRKITWAGNRAGDIAGYVGGRGYIYIGILGYRILAHRLAWFYSYGVWPDDHIDHINGCKIDNRLENLRIITNAQNIWGSKIQKRNTSGHKGIFWDKSRQQWTAKIT